MEALLEIGLVKPDQVEFTAVVPESGCEHVAARPQAPAAAALQLAVENHLFTYRAGPDRLRVPAILVTPGEMAQQITWTEDTQAVQSLRTLTVDSRQRQKWTLSRDIFVILCWHEYRPNRFHPGKTTQSSSRSMIAYTEVQTIGSLASSKPAIFPTAHLTVVWLRFPKFLPISEKDIRVNRRAR